VKPRVAKALFEFRISQEFPANGVDRAANVTGSVLHATAGADERANMPAFFFIQKPRTAG
jgi:hypothetical protein